jgi:hypothetical protein
VPVRALPSRAWIEKVKRVMAVAYRSGGAEARKKFSLATQEALFQHPAFVRPSQTEWQKD